MAANTDGAVVLTGTSTGIGRAAALYLDRQGYQVFAGVRKRKDADSLREEASERLTPVTIDVTKPGSIAAAERKVRRALGKEGLAGLVNNAGVGAGGPVEYTPLDDYRQAFEVNLFGQIAVTQAFLPLVRRTPGTIVNISSIGGLIASPMLSAYNSTKFALEALSDSLRQELRPWGIDVVVVEPGSIATEIWGKGFETAMRYMAELPAEGRRLYARHFERVEEILDGMSGQGIPAERVAEAIHQALRTERPKLRYRVGADAKIGARLNRLLTDRAMDRFRARQTKMPKEAPPGR
jgi:NAD(P)-dependent dehydrogenase (short-subunit alcohol dehydrogenase family)